MLAWDIQSISAWFGVLGLSVVGGITLVIRFIRAHRQMVELEGYLRMRKANFPKSYQHSLEHLTLHTSLTRDQIEKAARRSRKINRSPRQDSRGMALAYLLEWKGKP
jgi:hypothetical protein